MSEWGDCVTHYYGCKCRERAHKAMTERIEELEAELADLLAIVREVACGYAGYTRDKHHYCLICGRQITLDGQPHEAEHDEECVIVCCRAALEDWDAEVLS